MCRMRYDFAAAPASDNNSGAKSRVPTRQCRSGSLLDGQGIPLALVGEPFPGGGDFQQQFPAFAGLQALGKRTIFVRILPILVRILLVVTCVLHMGAPYLCANLTNRACLTINEEPARPL